MLNTLKLGLFHCKVLKIICYIFCFFPRLFSKCWTHSGAFHSYQSHFQPIFIIVGFYSAFHIFPLLLFDFLFLVYFSNAEHTPVLFIPLPFTSKLFPNHSAQYQLGALPTHPLPIIFPHNIPYSAEEIFFELFGHFLEKKKPSDIYISRAGQSSADKGILAFSLKTFRPFQVFESRSHLVKREKWMIADLASDHSILLQNQSFLLLHEILIISFNSIVWNWIIFHLSNHIRCFYNISNFELHKKHKQISQIFSIVCVWKVHHVSGFHQT